MAKQDGKISRNGKSSDEPVGIVISSGTRREDSPRFAAYVWGPVPESELDAALNAGLVSVA